jgi:hypothetical protein
MQVFWYKKLGDAQVKQFVLELMQVKHEVSQL